MEVVRRNASSYSQESLTRWIKRNCSDMLLQRDSHWTDLTSLSIIWLYSNTKAPSTSAFTMKVTIWEQSANREPSRTEISPQQSLGTCTKESSTFYMLSTKQRRCIDVSTRKLSSSAVKMATRLSWQTSVHSELIMISKRQGRRRRRLVSNLKTVFSSRLNCKTIHLTMAIIIEMLMCIRLVWFVYTWRLLWANLPQIRQKSMYGS